MTLKHNDRVLFGSNNLFLFIDPSQASEADERIDYDWAQAELAKASGFDLEGKDIEEQRRIEAVLEMLPMVAEVNAIAEEMAKGMHFELALVSSQQLMGSATEANDTVVMLRAIEAATDNQWLIDRGDFVDRRYEIQVREQCLLADTCLKWVVAYRQSTKLGLTAMTRRILHVGCRMMR